MMSAEVISIFSETALTPLSYLIVLPLNDRMSLPEILRISFFFGRGSAKTASFCEFNINAMTALTKGKPALTRSGAMLFVLNATGVQLIPSTVVLYLTSSAPERAVVPAACTTPFTM